MSWLFRKKETNKRSTDGADSASPVTPRDADFPVLKGVPYIDFLAAYHAARAPSLYLEVGTQKGKSLAAASCDSISIDPEFQIDCEVMGGKPALYLFQGTSDDFFASNYLEAVDKKIDFAFLDGMHLFEFLLRDFINAERHASEDGVVSMHDCVPYARVMAHREWDKSVTRSWTGDVWKLIPILRSYRPDLKIEVLDCPPTSLVLVSQLDPLSAVLSDAYEEILSEYLDLSLETYGVERFVSELDLVSSETYLKGGSA